ncbi:MAG: pyrroloquinoline quinone-dependent dehydrogenase [Acidobacteriota bacterium]
MIVSTAIASAAWLDAAGAEDGEWRTYGADLASTRYAPLSQIDKSNFASLEVAWRFKTDSLGPRPDFLYQATPLMVGGVVYVTAGTRRAVVALDAASGELLWMHAENEGARGDAAPRKGAGRGVAYWTDGRDARVIYVTPGYRMIALDAKTGAPVSGFGRAGVVDLKLESDQTIDLTTGEMGLNATPIIAGNIIVVGSSHRAGGAPKSKSNARGAVRAYDARTGKRLWIFHTIPRAGEFGYDTWDPESNAFTGNMGSWAQMSVDESLGLVYVGVEMPTGDYYGGHRPGNTLFDESLVALDLKTGQRRWHYQFVHHGVWDMDLPCAAILADIVVDGRRIKALAQPTKQAWLYVLDRETGKPVWPIEERPVPQSTVPGEQSSPTQPFVTRPAAFDRQGVTHEDLIDFTPALHAEAIQLVSRYQIGPLFTPPAASRWPGPLATLILPADVGGANWPGGSLDPDTNIVYVHSHTQVIDLGLVEPSPQQSDMRYVRGVARNPATGPGGPTVAVGGGEGLGLPPVTVQGLPLIKPPYDRITAIDINKGEIVWQKTHGSTPDNVKNHPLLRGMDLPRLGTPGRTFAGTLATKTLLIAGENGFHTLPSGQRGAFLRAYDKASGADIGTVDMPAPAQGAPMTYMHGGKQYIVIAVSGGNYGGELIAFRLPADGR